MSTTFASRAEAPGSAPAARPVLVWDAPVRVFHWLMVACFAGAWLTAESEYWRLLHVTLGYTMAGLVAFRLVWGLIGTRHARFANFVQRPAAVAAYLRSLLRGQPQHYTGHNPAGALAILALLGCTVAVSASGWAAFNELGGAWLGGAHEIAANLMVGVIGLHLAGVLVSSRLHRENLVRAMFTGRKPGRPQDGVAGARPLLAAALLAAVLGFWWLQWQSAPAAAASAAPQATAVRSGDA